MFRSVFLFLFICFLCQNLQAQKEVLTLDKAILGSKDMRLATWSNTQWSHLSNTLYYTRSGNFIYQYDAKKNTTDSVDIVALLNPALKAAGYDELKSAPRFKLGDMDEFEFSSGRDRLSFNMKDKKLTKVVTTPDDADMLDGTGNAFSFSRNQALYVQKPDENVVMIAQGSDSILYGTSVHRDEFGISKGTFWSPKGNKLAFYRMDQSMVEKYPIPDWSVTPAKVNDIYYPMAGRKSHHVTVGIFDLKTEKTIYLETGGDPEHYLTNICWAPDESEIYIAEINRDQNHTTFNVYNPDRGNKIRTLYEEQSLQYTEPLVPFTFVPGQNDLFIAQSKRDGWNSLYLYTHEGELVRKLTGGIEVTGLLGFDKKNKTVYFQGILPNSIDEQYFSCDLATAKVTQHTNTPGQHTAIISYDGKYAFETNNALHSNISYTCRELGKNKVRTLHTLAEPLDNYNLGNIKLDTLYSADGDKLFTRTIFPYNFDPAKKYPVVIYVYGGPHAQMISNSRNAQAPLWMFTMANEGFIIFTLDNRGSSNRGMEFEKVIHRNLGTTEIQDQMVGYEFIKNKPYVDASHIGVHGWSFGGFMTISLMTRQSGKFYAAVAGGPVTDWNMYEVMYGERYMDTPQQNPEGYKQASTFTYIDQLQGPLLIIHGALDDVVVWQQSMKYIDSCIKKGKQVDYFVYPGHKHNVLGKDRVHLIRKVIDFFESKL